MKRTRAALIAELTDITAQVIQDARPFQLIDEQALNFKPGPKSWSVLECLEHLNRYGYFYLPEIEKRVSAAPESPEAEVFKSSWLGGKFAKSLEPYGEKVNKMRSPGNMNPNNSQLSPTVVDKFLKQQRHMQELLPLAEKVDLQKVKTSTSLSAFIKLRLGDTLMVVIYHNRRHVAQAQRVLQVWQQATARA